MDRIVIEFDDDSTAIWANVPEEMMDLITNYIESLIGFPDTHWL